MMDSYELEKSVWSDGDFAVMGWHDVTVWAIGTNPEAFELALDLDYIFKWVDPAAGETYYKFWVSPATMVFENVHSVNIDMQSEFGAIEIGDLHRDEPTSTRDGKATQRIYRFECQEAEIALSATGFKMFVRQQPILLDSQSLGLERRGGISFARQACVI
jgi:hypothetical protein